MPSMKSFDEADWSGFAGCVSDDPKIGEINVNIKGMIHDGVIIADDQQVGIELFDPDGEREFWLLLSGLSDQAAAEQIATSLPDTVEEQQLLELGFRHEHPWLADE